MNICGEDGTRYEYKDVAQQFLMHFEKFLGICTEVRSMNEEDDRFFDKKKFLMKKLLL